MGIDGDDVVVVQTLFYIRIRPSLSCRVSWRMKSVRKTADHDGMAWPCIKLGCGGSTQFHILNPHRHSTSFSYIQLKMCKEINYTGLYNNWSLFSQAVLSCPSPLLVQSSPVQTQVARNELVCLGCSMFGCGQAKTLFYWVT